MGIGISLGGLAGAVAAEGGAGVISAAQIGFREPDFDEDPLKSNLRAIHKEVGKARTLSKGGAIGMNIMTAMNGYESYVREAVKQAWILLSQAQGFRWICRRIQKEAILP